MAEHLHFVTGRLAEHALRAQVQRLAAELGFTFTIDVLPITVAALMSTDWIRRHLPAVPGATRMIIPGYCGGDLAPLAAQLGVAVERGPRDLRQLPEYLGGRRAGEDYGAYDIQILAEINHAPRLSQAEILAMANHYAQSGADLIDVGCEPGDPWSGVGDCVRALCEAGFRVSIDSLNPREIELAVRAGAELVLSVNSSNRAAAADWGCEVVAIPDEPSTLDGLEETVDVLAQTGVPLRIDPILEPIGFGFAASLGRYLDARRRYPDAEIMMGIGNLTELTDVDSAGVNVLLLGICQELGIRSVLTTEVINWARSSVRECDLGRRMVHYAVKHRVPPKHLEPNLIMLRDVKLSELTGQVLDELAAQIRDRNYRIFAEGDLLHLVSGGVHLQAQDPFLLFDQLLATQPKNLDPSHAFYLGYELAKATTALRLGKQYEQDESLDWGFLTVKEVNHRLSSRKRSGGS